MTNPSFSASVSASINQVTPTNDQPSIQPAKHQVLDKNSILLKVNVANASDVKGSIQEAVRSHFQSLRSPSHNLAFNNIFKDIEALQLEPGQILVLKKEDNDSISLSFAKERKIRIGKALGKAVNCLRSGSTQSDRTSFGGVFGNKFIAENPALILTAPTAEELTDSAQRTTAARPNNNDSDDEGSIDDGLSTTALADASLDPPGEFTQSGYASYSQPVDAPAEFTVQHDYSPSHTSNALPPRPMLGVAKKIPHHPQTNLKTINETSSIDSSDDELSTTALSGNTQQYGPGPDTDTSNISPPRPPMLGVAKKIHQLMPVGTIKPVELSEDQQLSTLFELGYQQSKPHDNRLQVAIAGHGSLDVNYESFEIPPNVTVRTWRIPGQELSDPIGKKIEDLQPGQSFMIKESHSNYLHETIFKPGDKMPNYMVYPPTGLKIADDSITVAKKTSLAQIIKEQAENYDGTPIQIEFSACQSYSIPKFGKNEGQNIENLRIRLGIMQRDVFALMNEPRENQNTKVLAYHLESLDTLKGDFAKHKQEYNQQTTFELRESTGELIGDAAYVDLILNELSYALENPNSRAL